jgi:hypothetical protein
MLRFVIWLVVVLALWMLLRLIILSLRNQPGKAEKQIVIDMPARVIHPLQIRSYHFRDLDPNIGPADPARFCERLYLELSTADDSAVQKKYSLLVATPAGLEDYMRAENRQFQFGRNLLLVERFDMDLILRAVSRHLDELGALAEEVR